MTRLLAALQPLVVKYCRARMKTFLLSTVDDVAQEIYIGVLQALPRLRDPGAPFLPIVYGIAAHKVADAVRATVRSRVALTGTQPDTAGTDEGPEHEAIRADQAARLAAMLVHLPQRQREVLVLRLVVGLSGEETAEAVGSTPGAVRVSQHRALTRLRAMLDADRGLLVQLQY